MLFQPVLIVDEKAFLHRLAVPQIEGVLLPEPGLEGTRAEGAASALADIALVEQDDPGSVFRRLDGGEGPGRAASDDGDVALQCFHRKFLC